MTHAIRMHQNGGPEVLGWEAVEVPAPAAGEVTVRHHAVGLNYIDVYHRTGLYPLALPSGIGLEGAGVVTAVGAGVSEVTVGDRVAYAGGPLGAYAEVRNIPAHRLLVLPASIGFETAAAMMLQGLTAAYLLRRTYRVQPGDAVLIHAAAGGVGLIACQWAKALGATVIGTVGSPAKAELAKAHGCHHVINYSTENFTARVREITGGEGVAVVYDSWVHGSWKALRDMTNQKSGPIATLGERPWIKAYVETRRSWLANHRRSDLQGTTYRMDAFLRLIEQGYWGLELPLVIRGAEISPSTLRATPPGCYDGPQPGTRNIALQSPLARGLDVRLVQLGLSEQGVPIKADGIFGQTSANLLKQFQAKTGLPATGVADAVLIGRLLD